MGGLFAALSDEGKKWPGIHCFALAFYMAWYHMTFFRESWIRFNAAGPRAHLSSWLPPDSCGSFRSSGVPSSSNVEGSFASAGYFRLRSCCDCGSLLMLFSVGFLTPFFFGLGSCVSAAEWLHLP